MLQLVEEVVDLLQLDPHQPLAAEVVVLLFLVLQEAVVALVVVREHMMELDLVVLELVVKEIMVALIVVIIAEVVAVARAALVAQGLPATKQTVAEQEPADSLVHTQQVATVEKTGAILLVVLVVQILEMVAVLELA